MSDKIHAPDKSWDKMNDEEKKQAEYHNPTIRVDDSGDLKVLRICLPLESFAKDPMGTTLYLGTTQQFTELGRKMLAEERARSRVGSQLIKPNGQVPEITVH